MPVIDARKFQSALRFAVVSDVYIVVGLLARYVVSIRFKVRGGFRPALVDEALARDRRFNPL